MPPKKRKQSAAASAVAKRAPSPEPEMTTPSGKAIETTAASSRAKRNMAMLPPDQPASKKAKTENAPPAATVAGAEDLAPKRRGRPPKNAAPKEVESEAPKKRGRPLKNTSPTPEKNEIEAPKKRGRPPKNASVTPQTSEGEAPKRRGRPPKNANATSQKAYKVEKAKKVEKPTKAGDRKSARLSIVSAPDIEIPPTKKRTKTAAAAAAAAAVQEEEEGEEGEEDKDGEQDDNEVAPPTRRGRGRPPKRSKVQGGDEQGPKDEGDGTPNRGHYHLQHLAVEQQIEDELTDAVEPAPTKKGPKRKAPGRKPKKAAPAVDPDDEVDYSNDANITEATTIRADLDADDDDAEDDRSYWLMKAEPESRIEKNANGEDVNVKFSIDDLRSKDEPEPWDGIRNHEAKNNLKAMKVGDLAFFYESNCKKPGIVGIMEVVREATPDLSAFSKDSVYYDPKSDPEDPKWVVVHVEFRRKFARKILLKQLQTFSKTGGVLADMGLFKQSRLSVSKVSHYEWEFVMSLIEDDEMLESDAAVGGDRIDDTADLGNDFATAFEAPPNLGASESPPAASTMINEQFSNAVEEPQAGTKTITDVAPEISAKKSFEAELAQAAESPPDANIPAMEVTAAATNPTVEEPTAPAVEVPASSGSMQAPNGGLRVKSQARSVSRGRSKKPVPPPAFRATSGAKSGSKPAPRTKSTSKPASRTSSRRGKQDGVMQDTGRKQEDTIIEEDDTAVDGDTAMA